MYRFYVDNSQIQDEQVNIVGEDVNHIKNVLRMKPLEEIIICNGQGTELYCIIEKMSSDIVTAKVLESKHCNTELKSKIYLFQGMPKKDKMELIIQKAVELGVYEIIPVMTRRTIVKLDDKKKEDKKLLRWQTIAEGAAKQSHRGIIPIVREAMSFIEAVQFAKTLDYTLIPYENAKGISETKKAIEEAVNGNSIGIFIGPEGGFEDIEIDIAKGLGMKEITLGNRILRTETAGITMLSILMFSLEG